MQTKIISQGFIFNFKNMAKELPYFKFEPAEWMFGRIQKRSLQVQANFVNLCCKYWHKLGQISVREAELDYGKDVISELLEFEIIIKEQDAVRIKFLDDQLVEVREFAESQRIKGSKSAAKRNKNSSTTVEPLFNHGSTDDQPTIRREEKRIEENRKEEKRRDDIAFDSDFESSKKLDDVLPKYLEQRIAIETAAKNCRMSIADVRYSATVFKDQLLAKGVINKSLKDFTEHFYNWLLKVPVKPKAPISKEKKRIVILRGDSDDQKNTENE
jgi:hypothetical protein